MILCFRNFRMFSEVFVNIKVFLCDYMLLPHIVVLVLVQPACVNICLITLFT